MSCNYAGNDPETGSVLSVQILGVGFLLFLCYHLTVKHDQPLYFTNSFIYQGISHEKVVFILHTIRSPDHRFLETKNGKRREARLSGSVLASLAKLLTLVLLCSSSTSETKRTKQCYCQALYFNNPPKLMPDQTKRALLKPCAHTGQCTPTHFH